MSNIMVDEGADITGATMYERLGTSDDLVSWPNETPMACGSVSSIPSVCNFVYPIGTYVDGAVQTVPGFEALDTTDYL